MKHLTLFTTIILMTLIFLSDGCRKDKEKVLNNITISGNANTLINGDYTPEAAFYVAPSLTGCGVTMYRSYFRVNFTSGAEIQFYLFRPTLTATIPSGTFQPQGGIECAEGFSGYFFPGTTKSAGYYFTGGSVKIAVNGGTYDVDIDIDIDGQDGGGKVKGNFNGTISLQLGK